MNCPAWEELLQDRLDGAPPAAAADHLTSCPACREWHTALNRLEEGLRLLPSPAPPPGMSRRIVAAVLAERRGQLRRQRWARVAVGLAAAVLVFILLDKQRPPPNQTSSSVPPEVVVAEAPTGSLRESVTEASSAVVNLTRRTADETVGSTRLLLPVVVARAPTEEPPVPSPMDPSVRSLREAGQGLSAGLEPVTSSARRAFDLFLREVPPMETENKSGL